MHGWWAAGCGTLLIAAVFTAIGHAQIAEHRGMCDASAAVGIGAGLFIVANDEDNVLRVYSGNMSGELVHQFDLTGFLKPEPSDPETDIEGAARIGDRIYWIASHGADKRGRARPSRHRFFATDITLVDGRVSVTPVGQPYRHLVEDLSGVHGLADLKAAAINKGGDAIEGLNIEGIAATVDGRLLIGFRNPLVGQEALIVPLDNPSDVISGQRAKLGQPITLSLGNRGIRDMAYSETLHGYLLIAGPNGHGAGFELYRWSGAPMDLPARVDEVRFDGFQPEALVMYPDNPHRVQILSDDGGLPVDGHECKAGPFDRQSFRSVWITP